MVNQAYERANMSSIRNGGRLNLDSMKFLAFIFLPIVVLAVEPADTWRKERRIIDLHMHLGGSAGQMARAVGIMDRAGLGIGVNLSGGTVTRKDGQLSAFEKAKALADARHPGRFVHYMNL